MTKPAKTDKKQKKGGVAGEKRVTSPFLRGTAILYVVPN